MTTILHPDGSSLEFDALVSGSIIDVDQVTSHPIEDSAAVSDHVALGPRLLIVRVLSTETPIEGRAESSGPNRIVEVRDFLERCRGERLTVLLDDFRFRQIDDLVLQRTSAEIRRFRDLPLDLEFVQVRVASAEVVAVPAAARQSSAFSPAANGSEQSSGAAGGAAAAADASLLVSIFGG